MLDSMNAFIEKHELLAPGEKVVLAVSGGVDSVVMAELFRQRGPDCVIAHCNFGLRGADSDEDEQFSKALAGRFGIPFFSKHFDLSESGSDLKAAIQEKARTVRYQWFEELAKEQNCTRIATAHHQDDQAETFMMHLARGSGLKGLSGIPARRGKIIRPLLFARRSEIREFAMEQGLDWREDVSNQHSDYLRNKVRNEVFPVIEEHVPGFTKGLLNSMDIIRGAREAADSFANQANNKLILDDTGTQLFQIPSSGLSHDLLRYLLFSWLNPFGFNAAQIGDILRAYENGPGRQVHSDSHTVESARHGIYLLEKSESSQTQSWTIAKNFPSKISDAGLSFTKTAFNTRSLIPNNPDTAMMDMSSLSFPLEIRYWRPGDAYRPLGMRGNKLLSDLFIDAKVPRHQRSQIPVIIDKGTICWVAGFRVGELYKVSPSTKEVLIIKYENEK